MKKISLWGIIVCLFLQFCLPLVVLGTSEDSLLLHLSGEKEAYVSQTLRLRATVDDAVGVAYLALPNGLDYQGPMTSQTAHHRLKWRPEERVLSITTITTQEQSEEKLELTATPILKEPIEVVMIAREAGDYQLQLTSTIQQEEVISNEVNITIQQGRQTDSESLEGGAETANSQVELIEREANVEMIESSAEPEKMTSDQVTGEAEVTTWAEFAAAVKDPNIYLIQLTANFSNPRTTGEGDPQSLHLYAITRSLEINGNGHRVNFQGSSLFLGDPGNARPTFHLHDIMLEQRYAGGYSEDIVGSRLTAYSGKWHYRFGNVTTEASVQRLARAQYADVTLYGQMKVDTRAENFYLGSLKMEEETIYRGNVNHYDFSIFYYNLAARTTDTGYTQEFTVGARSDVFLMQSQKAGTSYPAVFHYYTTLRIGEEANFNVNMPGNSVRFNFANSNVSIKRNATVNLKNAANKPVVNFAASNTSFTAEPGASVTIIGMGTSESAVNISNGTFSNNTFQLTRPRYFDIRNLGNKETSRAISLGTGNRIANTFDITEGDMAIWYTFNNNQGPPDYAYENVAHLQVIGSGNMQKVTSDNLQLQEAFEMTYISRMTSVKHLPTLEFDPLTDAHLSIRARVKLGEIPDNNGANSEGVVTSTPIYAGQNQYTAYIDDSYGIRHKDIPTDKEGYLTYKGKSLNVAGTTIKVGLIIKLPTVQIFEKMVSDLTPPEPVYDVQVAPDNQQVRGKASEVEAELTCELNGVTVTEGGQPVKTIIKEDGTWELSLAEPLKPKDKVQFFLQDQVGNRNPVTDTPVFDALFKAGTILTVKTGELQLSVPSFFSFGEHLAISAKAKRYPLQELTGKLMIQDTRSEKSPVSLSARMTQALTSSSGAQLPEAIVYRQEGQEIPLSEESVSIYTGKSQDDHPIELSADWLEGETGLILKTTPGKVKAETYEGAIEWTLKDVPANE